MFESFFIKINKPEYAVHETKRSSVKRFFIVFGIFLAYLLFVCWKYGVQGGIEVGLLTWAFFVFCTPVADAGFLVGFPARVLAGVRMIYSEVIVTVVGFLLTAYFYFFKPFVFEKTALLRVYFEILSHPNPFWLIIIVSTVGTFLSIYFGDELIDVARNSDREKYKRHRKKFLMIVSLFFFLLVVLLYDKLLALLGVSI